jgi:hypothetical protein
MPKLSSNQLAYRRRHHRNKHNPNPPHGNPNPCIEVWRMKKTSIPNTVSHTKYQNRKDALKFHPYHAYRLPTTEHPVNTLISQITLNFKVKKLLHCIRVFRMCTLKKIPIK